MSRYRVIFFKGLLGIDGHPDKCLQQSVVIRRARSAERRLGLWQADLDRLFVVCAGTVKFAPGFKSFAATIVSCPVPRI